MDDSRYAVNIIEKTVKCGMAALIEIDQTGESDVKKRYPCDYKKCGGYPCLRQSFLETLCREE